MMETCDYSGLYQLRRDLAKARQRFDAIMRELGGDLHRSEASRMALAIAVEGYRALAPKEEAT